MAQRSIGQLNQALLATAFRGKLTSQDPSDAPASVLLERILRRALPCPKPKQAGDQGVVRF